MAAMTKDELLAVTRKEYGKLVRLIGTVSEDQALLKDADDTSIKDVIGHRAHWIALYLTWYRDGMDGKDVQMPSEGYKWNELTRYNAYLRTLQADLSWDDAVALLDARTRDLVAFIEAHSDDELYAEPMRGGGNDWRPGRWAEAAGPSHFRSAAKYLRARMRALRESA